MPPLHNHERSPHLPRNGVDALAAAVIVDFGWFTNVSDYGFAPSGRQDYFDFGYSSATFPAPRTQLASYRRDLHVRMGGIRKPRLGNSELLREARAKGFLLPGGEASTEGEASVVGAHWAQATAETAETAETADGVEGSAGHASMYAQHRNLNFSRADVRAWYSEHEQHYREDGVGFFWNDEGETDYYTNYFWNVAQMETLRLVAPELRFYSINRAWTPGSVPLGINCTRMRPAWDCPSRPRAAQMRRVRPQRTAHAPSFLQMPGARRCAENIAGGIEPRPCPRYARPPFQRMPDRLTSPPLRPQWRVSARPSGRAISAPVGSSSPARPQ